MGPSPRRRVVVTGVGLVSPLGVGTELTWRRLLAGESGVGPITRFDATEYPSRIAGEVPDFDPLQYIEKKERSTYSIEKCGIFLLLLKMLHSLRRILDIIVSFLDILRLQRALKRIR